MLWLADALHDAGLIVIEEPGWRDRGSNWAFGNPIGGMQHHTACCMPYPIRKLYPTKPDQHRIKCNVSVQPGSDIWTSPALVHMVSAEACNYSSGRGSSVVFNETLNHIAPSASARKRGLVDNHTGNIYYWNNETAHPGDGSPLPGPMYEACVIMWGELFKGLQIPAETLVGHGEWTARKIDPRWNGKLIHANMVEMRRDVASYLSGHVPSIPTGDRDMYKPITYQQGFGIESGDDDVRDWQKVFVALGESLEPFGADGKAGNQFLGFVNKWSSANVTNPVPGALILGPAEGAEIIAALSPSQAIPEITLETEKIEVVKEVRIQ